jgi:hypothetical protein
MNLWIMPTLKRSLDMEICALEKLNKANDLAVSRLSARGICDPRLHQMQLTVQGYDAIREYDSLLAGEVIKCLRELSSAKPPESKKPEVKHTWAERAYA